MHVDPRVRPSVRPLGYCVQYRRWRKSPDLADDQKIVQHPHRSELLLNSRLGSRKVLNPRSHMKRLHGRLPSPRPLLRQEPAE